MGHRLNIKEDVMQPLLRTDAQHVHTWVSGQLKERMAKSISQ